MSTQAQRFAANGRLIVFVGAGVSSIPPTCLPSWWAMNGSVIAALRDRVAELVGADRARALADAITTRQEANKFPPEYQAEVIVRRLRDSYFTVLQCLDSDTPNDIHLGIAALAKAGRVPVVVTTNFDRALEAAFRELDVKTEVWSDPAQFPTLEDRMRQIGQPGAPCPILKLHGSAEKPATLVDTLSQRKRGFPPAVAAWLRGLLRYGHWLFLGYSGADLMADENYLFLKPDAAEAQGFTWLLRTAEKPVEALSATQAVYGSRAEIVHSELPDWLVQFSQPLLSSPAPRAVGLSTTAVDEIRRKAADRVADHAKNWATSERFDRNVLVFADLLDAVGEPASATNLVEQLYHTRTADERRSPHFGIILDTLANDYNQASRFDEAISLFTAALEMYPQEIAEEHHLGALNNLAMVYEKQGKTTEALRVYEQVLAFAEKSGKAASRGIALNNIAMIRREFGEDDEAERLYREELDIVRGLGDEPARAFVLNNLGEIEVSRGRFDRGMEYLKEAVSIRDRIGDDLRAAYTRGNLANAHSLQHENEPALQYYEQSLDVFRRFGDRANVARTLANVARVKENIGNRDEAIASLDQALAEAAAIGADPVRAQALELVGEIQQKEGRNEEAASTFQELIGINERIHNAKSERDARVGLGIALKELKKFEPAIVVLREALALTDRYRFPLREWVLDHLADALNREGLARQESGDLKGALESFLEPLDIWRRRGSPYNEGQTLMNIGNTQIKLQQYVEAAATFQSAEAALLLANKLDRADDMALISGELYLWLDQMDKASEIFRTVVSRAPNYEVRADRMNRIGQVAGKQLQSGAAERALRVFRDCCLWNLEDGFLPDAAACMMNVGSILNATGDTEGARPWFEKAVTLLEDQSEHPLLAQLKALLSPDPPDR